MLDTKLDMFNFDVKRQRAFWGGLVKVSALLGYALES